MGSLGSVQLPIQLPIPPSLVFAFLFSCRVVFEDGDERMYSLNSVRTMLCGVKEGYGGPAGDTGSGSGGDDDRHLCAGAVGGMDGARGGPEVPAAAVPGDVRPGDEEGIEAASDEDEEDKEDRKRRAEQDSLARHAADRAMRLISGGGGGGLMEEGLQGAGEGGANGGDDLRAAGTSAGHAMSGPSYDLNSAGTGAGLVVAKRPRGRPRKNPIFLDSDGKAAAPGVPSQRKSSLPAAAAAGSGVASPSPRRGRPPKALLGGRVAWGGGGAAASGPVLERLTGPGGSGVGGGGWGSFPSAEDLSPSDISPPPTLYPHQQQQLLQYPANHHPSSVGGGQQYKGAAASPPSMLTDAEEMGWEEMEFNGWLQHMVQVCEDVCVRMCVRMCEDVGGCVGGCCWSTTNAHCSHFALVTRFCEDVSLPHFTPLDAPAPQGNEEEEEGLLSGLSAPPEGVVDPLLLRPKLCMTSLHPPLTSTAASGEPAEAKGPASSASPNDLHPHLLRRGGAPAVDADNGMGLMVHVGAGKAVLGGGSPISPLPWQQQQQRRPLAVSGWISHLVT